MRFFRYCAFGILAAATGLLAGVAIQDRIIVRDDAVILVAVCNLPGTIVWVRSDGSLDIVVPSDDDLAQGRILRRAARIPLDRRYILRSTCPPPPVRSST